MLELFGLWTAVGTWLIWMTMLSFRENLAAIERELRRANDIAERKSRLR